MELNGPARVIDGDTIEISGQRIRLYGIDAPEGGQTCERAGQRYDCGQEAGWALAERIEKHWVLCVERDRDRYGRIFERYMKTASGRAFANKRLR